MSDEDQSWFDPVFVVQGRVDDGLEFATNPLRGLFIRMTKWEQQQWLKANPHLWRRVEDVLKKAGSQQNRVGSPAETLAAMPSSAISSDIRKGDKNTDSVASGEIRTEDRSPPHPPALAVERPNTIPSASASGVEDEIAIGSRRYVSADRLASIWGKSRRTLSRRIEAGKVPPMIRIGKKLYFEI